MCFDSSVMKAWQKVSISTRDFPCATKLLQGPVLPSLGASLFCVHHLSTQTLPQDWHIPSCSQSGRCMIACLKSLESVY